MHSSSSRLWNHVYFTVLKNMSFEFEEDIYEHLEVPEIFPFLELIHLSVYLA